MSSAHEAAIAAHEAAKRVEAAKREELRVAERALLDARPADPKAFAALATKRDHAANELRIATADREAAQEAEHDARDAAYAERREVMHVEADRGVDAIVALEAEIASLREAITKCEEKQIAIYREKVERRSRTAYLGGPPVFPDLASVRAEYARRHVMSNPLAGSEVAGAPAVNPLAGARVSADEPRAVERAQASARGPAMPNPLAGATVV